jgi:putative hydrolase of the HAD superfamily
MLQWIFFDVGSTLVDEHKACRRRIEVGIRGTDLSYQQFYDRMIEFYKQKKKGDRAAFAFFGLPVPPWPSEDEQLYPGAAECLSTLHPICKIGIIANQRPGTEERLQNFGLLPYIDLIVASAEEGVSKPDPAIYQLALRRAGCLPEEAVMVGDRLDNDIRPANALGMHTIWVKQGFNGLAEPQTEEETPDYTVQNLTEACRLLQSLRGIR